MTAPTVQGMPVPVGWVALLLKHVCIVRDCKHVTAEFVDDGFPVASIREVQSRYVNLSTAKQTTASYYMQLVEGGRRPGTGDLLFSRNATVGEVAQVPCNTPPFAMGQDVCLLRPAPHRLDSAFAWYALRSGLVQTQIALAMIGSTFKRVNVEQIRNLSIVLPPLEQQTLLVEFLDRETTKIDALIDKQEQLIATLREDRDAVWSKLLDDAADRAKSVKLRRAIDSIADGPFGSSLTSAHYVDEGARVIRLGNIGINEFKDADRAYISLTYARELSAHQVIAGDVVIAGLGDERMPLGRAVVIPEIGPAIVKADCFRVRPRKGLAPEFLAWELSAPQTRNQMALLARGATRARLNTSVVGEVTIPLPPIDRQRQIIEQSRLQLAKIDALIDKSTAMIETLREYRSALITDAVTGKIDVRGTA
jgi:type I restriction enzyme, S subunit